MSFTLKNKVALVTGSSKGLGKAINKKFAEAGAKVVVNFYNGEEKAQETYDELKAMGAEVLMIRADATDEKQVNALVAEVEAKHGPIDILVPNATPDQPQKSIEDYSWDDYMSMINFFVKSPFLLTRAVLPNMKERQSGRIISIASEVYEKSVGNFSAYVATKGAQLGWTRSMATELAPWGITVNSVCPGWIPVERHEQDCQKVKDEYLAGIPLNRWGKPQDVANTIQFLASDEASFITGENIMISGGNSHF
ncbi:3-oxoacyl-ACP reductase FabG [Lentisphaera profundi]|uniref:3-oxoacyl-ACP reductase FabG n=1 Tax=Lentisphaera profundi TaxID=1658616 RepID=A0ABY7VP22_9BACT|nr:3-oxoacyl-ACP reductase family protein [Lentisphaera profundi]WDE95702.1 3-oxoacyl-ACP reductase FabG [Lentisphaera profundi]